MTVETTCGDPEVTALTVELFAVYSLLQMLVVSRLCFIPLVPRNLGSNAGTVPFGLCDSIPGFVHVLLFHLQFVHEDFVHWNDGGCHLHDQVPETHLHYL
jgi:hypothetical protein